MLGKHVQVASGGRLDSFWRGGIIFFFSSTAFSALRELANKVDCRRTSLIIQQRKSLSTTRTMRVSFDLLMMSRDCLGEG